MRMAQVVMVFELKWKHLYELLSVEIQILFNHSSESWTISIGS